MARQQQNNAQQGQQIATIEPARMQMPAHVAEQYGLTQDSWRAVVDAVFPLAKSVGAVVMALAYCKQRNLDIFQRVVHIVPMRVGKKEVETVWPGIGLHRIQGHRQPDFAGWDACVEGPEKTFAFKGRKQKYDQQGNASGWEEVSAEITVPEWMQMTFYKMMHGQRIPAPGPKIYFMEAFSPVSAYVAVPNDRWKRAPRQMLEKCTEAAALRRAWPDVFGDEPTAEEMDGKSFASADTMPEGEYVEVGDVVDEVEPTDKVTPKRSDFGAEGITTGATGATKAEANSRGRKRTASDGGYEEQGRAAQQEQAEKKDDRNQSDSTEISGERVDADGVVTDQEPAAVAEPGPVPEGFDDWLQWAGHVSDRFRCASNLNKLAQVGKEFEAGLEQAPAEIRQQLFDLYSEKRQDHIEATK